MTAACRGFLEFREIGAVSDPSGKADILALESAGRQDRLGQRAGGEAFSILRDNIGKIIAEHHRPIPQHLGERAVVFELRTDLLEHCVELRVAAELVLSELSEYPQAGAFIAFREHNVEADDPRLVVIEKLVEHQR